MLDQLINALRAPWMDTTENLLLKVNGHLDALHGLFDWRNPPKCAGVAAGFALSGLVHLVLPFHRFLWALNAFLYLFWTPVWYWGTKAVALPLALPKRLRYTSRLRAGTPTKLPLRFLAGPGHPMG